MRKETEPVKVLCLTTSLSQLESLVGPLRQFYFGGAVDGLAVVYSPAEFGLKANPWITRRLREFSPTPLEDDELKPSEIVEAARCAILQERPELVLFPFDSQLKEALLPTLKEAGIGHLSLESQHVRDTVALVAELRNAKAQCSARPRRGQDAKALMQEHWTRLGETLRDIEGPCLLLGNHILAQECQARFPHIDFHLQPAQDKYPYGLSLFALSYLDRPETALELLRNRCSDSLLLEPVNTQMAGSRTTFRYNDYDNEFAFVPAEEDLREVLGSGQSTEVWTHRRGQAGPHPLPSPDGHTPLFASSLHSPPTSSWVDRYRIPTGERLKIVFADSGNVAGSVLHHSRAINDFTDSQAWALTLAPHPLIGRQDSDAHTFFLQETGGVPTAEQQAVLREADVFVFFEDDDELSPAWPFSLQDLVGDKPTVHLYIGYRVHQRSARLQRPGRRILSPLPHLLKMYPQAHFYAGFPPQETLELPLKPPLSEKDGICRVLHTPSVPHWTTARYPYHKDTEVFLRAAQTLKSRFGSKVEFHQVGGWSQSEVLAARQACDITFNQLRGFHGLSGDEAMLLERPCIQAFDRSNINRHHEYWGLDADFPWVTTTSQGLESALEQLITDPARRSEIGRKSRAFMLKYFSPQEGILPLLFHCYQAVKGGAVPRI